MTDPQRRAVEALTKIGVNWEEVDEEQANYAIEQEAGDVTIIRAEQQEG